MAKDPIVFALANPTPEIMPELARKVRPDVLIATGRSDYPNQVNNVLCFPFIFRGALDVGATGINEQMKMACVKALAAMAQEEVSDEVAMAYPGQELVFWPRLPDSQAVRSEFDHHHRPGGCPGGDEFGSGHPADRRHGLPTARSCGSSSIGRGVGMRAVFSAAKRSSETRIVYCDGEDERMLRAPRRSSMKG
jgi:malate dehydrogenase (oxaloacetate-decarboxylating)(NADP+)